MTDLLRVLPAFSVGQFANLLPALEKHGVTTSDLLTLDAADIGKRTQLPLLDVRRLCNAVLDALHADLSVDTSTTPVQRQVISTLDPDLDRALGGGIPAGYVTEVAGESGAGKTQFLLTLLLAVQLPQPRGLGRPALYLSTEAPLSTRRLQQLLAGHPAFHGGHERPTLDGIVSTVTPDLESQDHILSFQVPVEVERRRVGLLVVDSVAANYRAEFDRGPGGASASTRTSLGTGSSANSSNMGARGMDLVRLGMQLRELARKHNMAIVVANQVADRFTDDCALAPGGIGGAPTKTPYSLRTANMKNGVLPSQDTSPLARRSNALHPLSMAGAEPTSSMARLLEPGSSGPEGKEQGPPVRPNAPESSDLNASVEPVLQLDHQQRWFTGWGDELVSNPSTSSGLKTPSLGLVWSTQIAARIVLLKKPVWGVGKRKYPEDDDDEEARGTPAVRSWRRWMKVIFAPYAPASGPGVDGAVEFEITMGGLRGLGRETDEGVKDR